MTLTPRVKRCIDLAYKEAQDLGNNYIGTEHLLLGLVREGEGLAARVLTKLGVHLLDVREAVAAIQAEDIETGSVVTPQRPPIPSKATAPTPSPRNLDALLLLIRQNVAVPALVLLIAIADEENVARELLSRLRINYQSLQYDMEAGLINRTLPRSAITLDQLLQAANESAAERDRPTNSGDLLLAAVQLYAPCSGLKEVGFETLRDELNRMEA